VTLACRVFGHRLVFRADGPTMVWECDRGCADAGGAKQYPTAEDARRYATGFNRRDSETLGRRAPLLGLFPLRLWRRFRDRNNR
jgi:hypothetical protein